MDPVPVVNAPKLIRRVVSTCVYRIPLTWKLSDSFMKGMNHVQHVLDTISTRGGHWNMR